MWEWASIGLLRRIRTFSFAVGLTLVLVFLNGRLFNWLTTGQLGETLLCGSESALAKQCKIHERFMKEGKEFSLGKQEIGLTHKYWELSAWLKNVSIDKVQDDAPVPPLPFKFGNGSLWGRGFSGAADKVLPQVVWRLQLLIGNYVQKYLKANRNNSAGLQNENLLKDYTQHSFGTRPKRIFIGDVDGWPDWTMLDGWKSTGKMSGCYREFLDEHLSNELEPSCDLVTTRNSSDTPNWSDIDVIVQLHHHSPFTHVAPPPTELSMPWFKLVLESPSTLPFLAVSRTQYISSYWSGSLIQQKYSKWVYYDPKIRSRVQDTDYSVGKSQMVAMLVSNCADRNGRLNYADELAKYISVDIHGRCGDPRCEISSSGCMRQLQDYKFYLAFENSNCQEYATEKLFQNAFTNKIVPIVMGAPPSFYRRHAPQNSYIHVQDFESPKALAAYLLVLASNATMYNDYFQWRGTGESINAQTRWLCAVCGMLYYDRHLPEQKMGERVQWVSKFKVNGSPFCLGKNEWYW